MGGVGRLGVGGWGFGVQWKLVPEAYVSVLLASHVSLQSRLSSGTDDLCVRSRKIKDLTDIVIISPIITL